MSTTDFTQTSQWRQSPATKQYFCCILSRITIFINSPTKRHFLFQSMIHFDSSCGDCGKPSEKSKSYAPLRVFGTNYDYEFVCFNRSPNGTVGVAISRHTNCGFFPRTFRADMAIGLVPRAATLDRVGTTCGLVFVKLIPIIPCLAHIEQINEKFNMKQKPSGGVIIRKPCCHHCIKTASGET